MSDKVRIIGDTIMFNDWHVATLNEHASASVIEEFTRWLETHAADLEDFGDGNF